MANEETSARNGGGNLVGMFYMSPFIGGNMYKILLSELSNGVCGIYKIDFPNGKVYIGKSNNIKRRFYEHNRPDREQIVCDRAIHKYFGKVKEITILEECNQELLNDREKYWITFYESNIKEKGYNLTEGGDGGFSYCQNYWKNHPEKMKEHITKIQHLAAEAAKEWRKQNPEKEKERLNNLHQKSAEWRANNPEQFKENLKNAQKKAKEWREENHEQFEENRKKGR